MIKKILVTFLILAPIVALGWNPFASLFGAGDSTITRLDQWMASSSPFDAISPRIHGKGLYFPYSVATGTKIYANTFCINNGSPDCITSWSAGGGEANTASSLGTGLNLYDSKVGVDLRFNTLSAGSNITLSTTTNNNTIVISSTASGGGGADFPNVQSWGNSTSTVLGFLNGFLSTASSTQSGNFFLPALSQGLLFNGSGGITRTTATSSITLNAPITSAGTAGYVVGGSGWTLDVDDIQPADLASADFGHFTCNGTTCSLDANTVGAGALDETATPTFAGLTISGSGLLTFPYSSSTIYSSFLTSSSTFANIGTLTFGGVTGSAWSTFCTAITGGAGLCDGTDDTAAGGSALIATSTNETAGHLAYWSTTSGTPARLNSVATSSVTCTGGTTCSNLVALGSSPTISSFSWPFTPNTGYVSTTTTLGLLNGFFSTASSTFSSDLRLSALSQGFAYVGSTGKLNTTASSSINLSWFNNDAGFTSYAWPFTPQSWGVSTSTTLGLTNGFLATASSTIVGNATTTGGLYVGRLYGANLTACNSSNQKLLWTADGQFTCGTDAGAGGGITSLYAQYSSPQTGAGQVLATSSDTNILLTITSNTDTHTFTPSWTGTLATTRGGTGWGNIQANSILLGNGTGALATTSAGTNGQVLALVNGVPTWTATTTAGTGLTYSGGSFNVNTTQNISKLSNLTSNGFVKTINGDGTLSVDTNTYLTAAVTAIGPLNQTSSGPTVTLATSTTGTDFTITGSGNTLTFNLPTASASNRGLLSSADWTTFNNKSSFAFPYTVNSGYNSTSTTIGFTNGLFSTASSTFSGPLRLSSLSQGLTYVGSTGLLNTIATTSASCSGAASCTGFTVIGSSPVTISATDNTASTTLLADTNSWTGVNRFNFASSTYHSFGTASSTNYLGAGLQTCDPTTGKLTWSGGQFSCGTDQTGGGSSAYEIATSSNIAVSQLAYVTQTGGRTTLGSTATTSVSCSGSISCTGFNVLASSPITITGTDNTASSTLLSDTNYFSAVNRFNYASTTYHSFTTASTTNLNIGGDSFIDLTGTGLAVSGGVLNTSNIPNASLTNSTISGIALGSNLANLTATDGTLTFSGTYNGGTARTIGLNLGNANNWTALQTFLNASSTLFSARQAYFGGSATTTIGLDGSIVIPSGSNLTITGKSDGCATFASGVLNSTGSACGSGGGSAYEIATTSDIAVPNVAYFTQTGGRTTLGSVATGTISGANGITVTGSRYALGGALTITGTGWPFDANTGYNSTTTALGLLGGFFSTASSTISGDLRMSSLTQGWPYIGSGGLMRTVSTSTLSQYLFPNTTYGASTSTVIGFTGGLFSTASSTFSGDFFMPSLTQGYKYIGSNGITRTVSTSTLAGQIMNINQQRLGFSYATTTWSATTTIYLGPAYRASTINYAYCETDVGTVNVSLYDGTNRANMLNASTTIGKFNYSTNNTFTAGESMRVDIGTPATSPTRATCSFAFTVTD